MERSASSVSFSNFDSVRVRSTNAVFDGTSSRSLYVSLRSRNEDDAIPSVRTTEFSASVSRELLPESRREIKETPRPVLPEIRSDDRRPPAPFVPLGLAGLTLPQIERAAILETLLLCGGRRRQAARKLGVSEKTIYNKIKIYRLQPEIDAACGDYC